MSRPPLPLTELSAAFRQRGALTEVVSPEAARAFAFCAGWLDASLEAAMDKVLTLQEAREESGWSYEGLRRKLSKSPLNAAVSGAPMIRRRDLATLGAARGARGTYQSRKPKGPVEEAPSPSAGEAPPVPLTTPQEVLLAVHASFLAAPEPATVEHGERSEDRATVAPRGGTADPKAVERESQSLDADGDLNVTIAEPEDVRPRPTPGPRTAHARKRRGSPQDRFHDLCALAALS